MANATAVMMIVKTTAMEAAKPTRLRSKALWNISHYGTSVSPPRPPAVVL